MTRALLCSLVVWLAPPAVGQTGYAGSKACAACHRRIYDNYAVTAMGQSMRAAGDSRDLARIASPVTIPSGAHAFEMKRDRGQLFQREFQSGVFESSYKLEYAIGSGVNGVTYVVRRGAYLFEAPLSFFAKTGAWELSPGFERGNPSFSRPIDEGCLVCHSGRARAEPNREGLYADPPFTELAIGCENCHGPGEAHARRGDRRAIVNPAKLPAQLADDICMNCHQAGDTRVLQPGRRYRDFRPGAPLSDTLAIFKIPLAPDNPGLSDLLEHHFAIKLSKCYTASAGKLRCLTCHNPHAEPARENVAAYYRTRCLACHQPASCRLPRPQRGASDDCAGCHMPKRDVGVISHSALTNHRIVSRPDEPLPPAAFAQTTPDLPELIYLNRTGSQPVPSLTLLEAYGELLGKAPQFRERYLTLLAALEKSAPNEPKVQAALARRDLQEDNPKSARSAAEYAAKAIERGLRTSTAYEDLAQALVRAGRTEDAVAALNRGVADAPYSPRLYKLLAARYIDLKQYDQAKQTMKRYLDLFPEDDFMRGLLRNVETQ